MLLINLTPHKGVIARTDGSQIEIEPSGHVARVLVESAVVRYHDGIEFYRTIPGISIVVMRDGRKLMMEQFAKWFTTTNLDFVNEVENEFVAIVSLAVRTANPNLLWLASPGDLIRNANGQPIGCRGLVVN